MNDQRRRISLPGNARRARCGGIGIGLVLSLLATAAWADEPRDAKKEAKPPAPRERAADARALTADAQQAAVDETTELVPYVPRSRGKARHSAAGGTRTQSRISGVEVAVLAPAEIALTTRAQPVLYWYLSRTTDERIDLTLTDDEAIDPLLETTLSAPIEAGIHAIDLEALGIALEPGRVYSWSVAIVKDPSRRSTDVLVEGLIERTATSDTLERSLETSPRRFAPYALSGIWYDALAELRSALEADPSDRALRRQEVALLEQIDLPEVARFARAEVR